MLSLLIPVYNWDVAPLVKELHRQLVSSAIPFEIILGDDASSLYFYELNRGLENLPHVVYERHTENKGRAGMRNWLADRAQFPYLLFMDCDAGITSVDFIRNYLLMLERHTPESLFLIAGGVAYRPVLPDSEFRLRWYYGKKKEEVPASVRRKNQYKSFTPFNFLTTKYLFNVIRFEERITSYGHEDTLFGYHLKMKEIPIFHEDNPLYHEGLDRNEDYLQKIESGIRNLVQLRNSGLIGDAFTEDNRLLLSYERCKRYHLLSFIKSAYMRYCTSLRSSILKNHNLFFLDLYKLGYLASLYS